ncbi:hypothetical protein G7Z17_g12779 [Cylindrodendrum hubeiense]|uniref:Uncharacterized protein n=1 Tax=Cylindrodendrum hubeiense TaxID=595255 RepID=A0A9P5H2B8_9HYPO|nr:hypothetical protein G7Z17_g12779 [Cylindrodendrum hubeiense]
MASSWSNIITICRADKVPLPDTSAASGASIPPDGVRGASPIPLPHWAPARLPPLPGPCPRSSVLSPPRDLERGMDSVEDRQFMAGVLIWGQGVGEKPAYKVGVWVAGAAVSILASGFLVFEVWEKATKGHL